MSVVDDQAGPKRPAAPALTLIAVIFSPFLLLGATAIGYGVKLWVEQRAFLRTAEHADGTVAGFDQALSSGHAPTYHPIVRYTLHGASVQFRSRYAYSRKTYELDQPVDVLYDPADPTNAEVDSKQFRYRVLLLPAFGAGLGVMTLGGYLILLVIRRFVRRKREVASGESEL